VEHLPEGQADGMRILIVSNLYPPIAFGGYEVECAGVVERLREQHDVRVLTSKADGAELPEQPEVWRELELLTPDSRGARRAPLATVRAVAAARKALEFSPELIYVWNGSSIPQAALRVFADSDIPLAFRICEHWFGGLFLIDQFMRELLPGERGAARSVWAAGCKLLNRRRSLRLQPTAPVRAAICWNSDAIQRMVHTPDFVEPVLERVVHSVPRYGERYAAIVRDPAPEPEILYIGRVTPYKGVWIAIEALVGLRDEHDITAHLEIVGPEDAEHGANLRRLSEKLGVADAVRWRGQLPSEQVAAALARAHALIVPSAWDEPFPLVTIEGALARVPLVAADVGGIGEGMHDEEHALLFPRLDTAGATTALARVLSEPEQTAARVGRALERARMFGFEPYLEAQQQFVLDAHAALS
jgi:glycosyltransferase involved in cell wall biosynthesis